MDGLRVAVAGFASGDISDTAGPADGGDGDGSGGASGGGGADGGGGAWLLTVRNSVVSYARDDARARVVFGREPYDHAVTDHVVRWNPATGA